MEKRSGIYGTLGRKRNERVPKSPSSSYLKSRAKIKSQEKPCSAQTTDVQKEYRSVIERLELESKLAAFCRRSCRTEITRQMEKLETSIKMERDFPQRGGTGNAREREEKHLDQKLQGKFKKRNRSFCFFSRLWLKTLKLMTESEQDSREL